MFENLRKNVAFECYNSRVFSSEFLTNCAKANLRECLPILSSRRLDNEISTESVMSNCVVICEALPYYTLREEYIYTTSCREERP